MKRRGMALITSLLVSVLLLLLGVSFLNYLENDYRFAAHQEKSQQAYYLALAGLEYQKTRTDLLFPGTATPMPFKQGVPVSSLTNYFEVTVTAQGKVVSRGVVQSSTGLLLGERTLIVEPGSATRDYSDPTL
jgi:hypothetical protein